MKSLVKALKNIDSSQNRASKRTEPLFKDEAELEAFRARHAQARIRRKDLALCEGPLYLGIDAGSTTTKAALIDSDRNLVYSFYKNNEGNPLETTRGFLRDIYSKLPKDCFISYTTVTGYGEGLIQAGFNADDGIIYIPVTVQGQFCENASKFLLTHYQIVCPFDFRAQTGRGLDAIGGGNRCGTGQMHQIFGRTRWAQKHAQIDTASGGGMKIASHPSATAGLTVCDQYRAVGCTLCGELLCQSVVIHRSDGCIGNVCISAYHRKVPCYAL